MLKSSVMSCMAAAAVFLAAAPTADAHGYISVPPARNIQDSCRQCLSAGGPSVVNANGQYRMGMCGNSADDAVQVGRVSWSCIPVASLMVQKERTCYTLSPAEAQKTTFEY